MNDSSICHVNLAGGFRGGERQTFLLMEELASRGHEQRLIAKANSALAAKAELIEGLEVIESSLNGFDCRTYFKDAPLLHFHESRVFAAIWSFGIATEKKHIITRRVERPPRSNFINKSIYRNANQTVTLSRSISKSIQKSFNLDLDPIVIPSAKTGFTTDQVEVQRIRSKMRGDFIVGHIGALDDSHKGQLQIIELAQMTRETFPEICFLLVGSGKDMGHFKQLTQDLNNIEFVGQKENVGDYLAAFDLFIFPSRHEGLGSILLDAMDFGLPIIASNVGGIPEIIKNEVNGILVDLNSLDDYYNALKSLFSDTKMRSQMQQSNTEKGKSFSVKTMTDQYIKLYNQIL
ncbi:MAG TPA: glycosyltransferase family 1 protein [Gammaproteobacteria bacterium]|nr:glycosyltransferase family 1 protein [Gammaproteobacteria bacterium]